jgi:group I intron endonuclease
VKERFGRVYVLRNVVNSKEYVGQTIRCPHTLRWNQHIYAAFVELSNLPLYRAMRKYGLGNFTAEVVWFGPESKLNAAERRFVRQRKTFIDTGWGYNLTTGGGQCRVSAQTRKKLSLVQRARAERGPWMSDEARARISLIHLGTKASRSTCRKIAKAGKGRKQTTATKLKRAESLRAFYIENPEERKKVGERCKLRPTISDRTRWLLRKAAKSRPPVSEDTKARQRAAWVRRKLNANKKAA